MTVKDIIKAHKCCFIQDKESCGYCKECPLANIDHTKNCQVELAQLTIEKLQELTQLLDDKVNHHYYDTLETYQEENAVLNDKLDQIRQIIS